jgi:anti-anti-sigma factor
MSVIEIHPNMTSERAVLGIEGRFDWETCEALRHRIEAALTAGRRRIVINLGTEGPLDEQAVAVLVDAAETAARRGASFVVRSANPPTRRLLALLGLVE